MAYLCSANNNIPRVTALVEMIADEYGTTVTSTERPLHWTVKPDAPSRRRRRILADPDAPARLARRNWGSSVARTYWLPPGG